MPYCWNSYIFFVIILFGTKLIAGVSLTIGTYNLWNVMFNWKVRVQYMAELIKENDIDIIAFQEVRLTELSSGASISQLEVFISLLPEFKWALSRVAGTVTKPADSYWYGWNKEGLGLLSRKQIVSTTTVRLSNFGKIDTNPRIALHVQIRLDSENFANVIVVHFSYDRNQQCKNAEEILMYIYNLRLTDVIVLGDFNTYPDFPGPVDIFTSKRQSSCFVKNVISINELSGTFKDAWVSFDKGSSAGYTFSNMPEPGLVSRPDRILISKNVTIEKAATIGHGQEYQKQYYFSILLSRIDSMLRTSMDSFLGRSGYSCYQDCGPHGSCRCGVCVAGGNQLNCNIPNCSECSGAMSLLFLLFVFFFCVIFLMLLYSFVKVLVISSRFNQEYVWDILGYRCCLFNKELFLSINIVPRKYKSKLGQMFYVCKLPPFVLILLSLAICILLSLLFYLIFIDIIDLIYSVLSEEMFPSDHLMVFTKLRF